MLSGFSFRLAFVFNINSLVLLGFPLTSFHLAEASLSLFSWLYTLACAVIQKYHKMFFIYICSHFQYSFCNQPILFAQPEDINKLYYGTTTALCMWTNEIKTKAKPSHVTFKLTSVQLFNLAHKQSDGIIKGWLHCLTSESKERSLVNNILCQ